MEHRSGRKVQLIPPRPEFCSPAADTSGSLKDEPQEHREHREATEREAEGRNKRRQGPLFGVFSVLSVPLWFATQERSVPHEALATLAAGGGVFRVRRRGRARGGGSAAGGAALRGGRE